MTASAHQRRERILSEVFESRHVTARDLAVHMDVSEATVRRDLKALSDEGQLDLVYGGATLRRPSDFSFRSKSQRNIDAKHVIGKLAAGLVTDHSQIFVDSGTTCFEMAPYLKRKRNLSVIVNSARLALELDVPGLSVILLGGQYRPEQMDTIGPLATAALEQLRGYVCFVGTDGASMDFGLAAADMNSADLNRLAASQAREVVLVADQTKFLSPSLFKIVGWEVVSRVVTDAAPEPDWTRFFDDRGIQVIYPGSKENGSDRNEPNS